jgi:hypothetical protein
MAHVKWYFRHSAARVLRYILSHGEPGDDLSAHGCTPETAVDDFASTRAIHRSRGDTQVIHIMQSWSADESHLLGREQFHEIGRKLAERYFPGHEFVVKTHTDKAHTHNHIAVNAVNYETGRKFENKHIRHKLTELRRMSDGLCKARGLSIIGEEALDRRARMPEKVQQMARFKKESYILDTMQKADCARTYATSYSDYVGILSELGVPVRVEKENITYFYPGRSRGKRGDKLGPKYDKDGLEAAFKSNVERFAAQPELRGYLKHDLVMPQLMRKKDASHFDYVPRREGRYSRASEQDALQSILPYREVHDAARGNILDYCRRNDVGVEKHSGGGWCLKGREHVILKETEWVNTRNKTSGNLIDLVAAHKNLSLLQAVAKINGNPRLLLLEQYMGVAKRRFTSFHVPKSDRMPIMESIERVAKLLTAHGGKREAANILIRNERAHVGRDGVIKLFADGDDQGWLEYSPMADGGWSKKRAGKINAPFHKADSNERKATIFLDPLSYAGHRGADALSKGRASTNHLVLMEPNVELVDKFLATNRRINQIAVVIPPPGKATRAELDFFENLKTRYKSLGIDLSIGTPDLAQSRSRGLGLSL